MSYGKVGAEFAVNTETAGDQLGPEIATFADGSFLITWVAREEWPGIGQTIKAQLFDASGAKLGAEFQVNDQTTGSVFNHSATVLADGTLVVSWINNDTSTGGPGGVKARMFDSAGHALGDEFAVNTTGGGSKFTSQIAALSNGGFVVTWDDWGSWSQRGQIYDASGAKVGDEFSTHADASGFHEYGDVIALAGGGFVASWRTRHADGSWDVQARIFDNAGTATSGDFRLNTLIADDQYDGQLTALAGGGFVAVWQTYDSSQDGSGSAIKGQLFDSAGAMVGAEFRVNQQGVNLQDTPDVTALADGSFLVAWTTWDTAGDGSSAAVKVRHFGADGVPLAGELRLNTFTAGSQHSADLATLADGRVVAAWSSDNADGNGFAVRGQILYTANAAPTITSNGGWTSDSITRTENDAAVTTVTAIDSDGPLPVTYWIAGGADAGAFVIDKTSGVLRFAVAPDFEAPTDADHNNTYVVVVEARDGTWTDKQTLTVTVTDLDDGLSFAQTTLQAFEQSLGAGVLVASGGAGDPLSYAISGGADAALFALDAQTGALSFLAPADFEAPGDADGNNIYQVEVTADDGTLSVTRTISIALNNVNEGLAIVSGAAHSAVENEMAVGTIEAVDFDGDAVTYSVSGGADGALFWIHPETGEFGFLDASDFETPGDWDGDNLYEVEVSATDGEYVHSQLLTVAVTDVFEVQPLAFVNTAFAFAENAAISAALELSGSGPMWFMIIGGADASQFTINNETGVLQLGARNYEAPSDWNHNNIYEVQVRAYRGDEMVIGLVTVAVQNVNETPTITSNGGGASAMLTVNENTISVTTVVASDPDSPVHYTLAGGADAARFTIDDQNGALRFLTAPNFEAPTDSGGNNVYDVIVRATDGPLSDTQTLSIRVNDIVENQTLVGTSAADQLTGGSGNDVIQGMAGNDILTGMGGMDVIEGGDGTDQLLGGDGSDRLIGSLGLDTLTGGQGADRFEYDTTSESTMGASDRILDFSRGDGDKIVLTDIDASTRASGNQSFQFIGAAAFTTGSPSVGQLRAFVQGGDTYIQGDVNGDRMADFQIVLDGPVTLMTSDFML